MTERPEVELIGHDGNACAILGRCHRASRKADWTKEQWEEFKSKATSGNYDNLLGVVMEYFEVV